MSLKGEDVEKYFEDEWYFGILADRFE